MLPKGTTSRSTIENHLKRLKNPQISNQLMKPQIGASDLKNYLQINPKDLFSLKEKEKSERNLNILKFLLAKEIKILR